MVERVLATPKALQLIELLKQKHGPLMFHQSGGCCDGSAPMCYAAGEFRVGGNDVKLGQIGGCDVYMDADQFDYWSTPNSSSMWFRGVATASRSRRPKACGS
jgi:uncharacterized protein (DUF779 family)